MTKGLFFVLALLLCHDATHAQTIYYVTQNGAGLMNGSSWANAGSAAGLRQALNQGASGTQYWVAAGTYKPHPASRDSSFHLNTGVSMYGGFAGNETSIQQRNFITNITIFSGDIGVQGDSTDNSYHVVTATANAGPKMGIDGITITGGDANGSSSIPVQSNGTGGGLNVNGISSDTFVVRHCIFTHNTAYQGGGMFAGLPTAVFGARLLVDSCVFQYNTSLSGTNNTFDGGGAALSLLVNGIVNAPATVQGCIFQFNHSMTLGGAVAYKTSGGGPSPTLFKNCIISANTSGLYGGGLHIYDDKDLATGNGNSGDFTLDSCTISNNVSSSYGGGIFVQVYAGNPRFFINHSTISGNSGTSYGAIYSTAQGTGMNDAPAPFWSISNSSFIRNTCPSDYIGGIGFNSEQYAHDTSVLVNCLFNSNKCNVANLINYDGVQTTTLTNCTIFDDFPSANSSGGQTGGLVVNYVDNCCDNTYSQITTRINNCIVYFDKNFGTFIRALTNVNGFNQSSLHINLTTENSIIKRSGGSASWDATFGNDGGNNLDVNPGFADTANGDLHLSCGSPALNVGDNNASGLSGVTADLDGNARISSGTIDMGAYEVSGIAPIAAFTATVNNTIYEGTFTYTGTMPLDSLYWNFGDGQSQVVSNNFTTPITHTYATSGNYITCVTAYNCFGNNQTCNQYALNIKSVNHLKGSQVSPNPVNDQLNIKGADGGTATLTNSIGQQVLSFIIRDSQPMNVGFLPIGIYTLTIQTIDGIKETMQVVKL